MVRASGIGDTAKALIRMGAIDAEALELVRFFHPDGDTSAKSITWYRSQLVTDFEDVCSATKAPGLDRARLLALLLGVGYERSDEAEHEIGSHVETAREQLRIWRTNQQVLDIVLAVHPSCGYKSLNVSDLRTRMRGDGEKIPTDDVARRWQEGRLRPIDPVPPSDLAPPP